MCPLAWVGIGLSLIAGFAELHGGKEWVEHSPGGGASFRVFLPHPSESNGRRGDGAVTTDEVERPHPVTRARRPGGARA